MDFEMAIAALGF